MLIYVVIMVFIIIGLALAPIIIAEIGRGLSNLFPTRIEDAAAGMKIGDRIVYSKSKVSLQPCRRARFVYPSTHGDNYSYVVDKYWVVADLLADGRLVAKTRRGKMHYLRPDDANLRRAGIAERLLLHGKFPDLALAA